MPAGFTAEVYTNDKMSSSIGITLRAIRGLNDGREGSSTSLERLSTGLRINRASDDAAGLSVVGRLNVDRRVFTQGVRNLNDGISLLSIADSALENLTGITQRLQELAEQAANGTFSLSQRRALDAEAQELSEEYFRIARTTSFNGLNLFNGSVNGVRVQGGYGVDGSIGTRLGGAVGMGSFAVATSSNISTGVLNDVATADLNGDGIADLVTASGTNAVVRLGNGDGTFGAASTVTNGFVLNSNLQLVDINGDGRLDVFSGGRVAYGNGDGSFQSSVTVWSFASPERIRAGDFDGDGVLDLVTVDDSSRVVFRRGTGGGSFGAATTSYAALGAIPSTVEIGDVTGDGLLDVVFRTDGDKVFFARNLGGGTFVSPIAIGDIDTGSSAIDLLDVDGDGALEVVFNEGAANEFNIYRFTNGAFVTTELVSASGVGNSTRLMFDTDGDGQNELVTLTSTSVLIFERSATGSYTQVGSFNPGLVSSPGAFAIADANNDGVQDIISVSGSGVNSRLSVALNSTVDGVSPLLSFSLETIADARQALGQFSQSLDRLARQRGIIGANLSRLSSSLNVLGQSRDESAAASSRIQDADVATEAATLIRRSILADSAAAVLAQINQSRQIVAQLLRSGE